MISNDIAWWVWTLVLYSMGVLAAIDALWKGRTSQGTIAWVISLLLMPLISVPLYLFFGSRKFHGYRRTRQAALKTLDHLPAKQENICHTESDSPLRSALERLARANFTQGNRVSLLINGRDTFREIFSAIRNAQSSVLVQFYIIQDDQLGLEFQSLLAEKAAEGVCVHLLYDEIGSSGLPKAYVRELEASGVRCSHFNTQQIRHKLQLNFRNHRKLVVIDEKTCFIGGHNIGDEYLGQEPYPPWRDTHLRIDGPATGFAQRSFVEDWHWATHKIPDLNWPIPAPEGDACALVMAGGPADPVESISLTFVHLLHQARKRIWIATPYFVPDLKVLGALQLAALKGLDVCILLPEKSDNRLVDLASLSYVSELSERGIRFLRYRPGFMHQKVMLIDNSLSLIGSANLDNRSLRINFELNALIDDASFAHQVSDMLEHDMAAAVPFTIPDSLFLRFFAKAARLFSPVL